MNIVAGTSSFGMSGVNAHMILRAASPVSRTSIRLPWQKMRTYALPRHFTMVDNVTVNTGETALFVCRPAAARLSWLRETTSPGQSAVSAAALIESAASASRQFYEDGDIGLSHLSFASHLELQSMLSCRISLRTGKIQAGLHLAEAILTCFATTRVSAPKEPAKQAPQSHQSCLRQLLKSAQSTASFASLQTVEHQGEYSCHPGICTAALHINMLSNTSTGAADHIDEIAVGNIRSNATKPSVVGQSQEVALPSSVAHYAVLAGIYTKPIWKAIAAAQPSQKMLYTTEWLVEGVQEASSVRASKPPLYLRISAFANAQSLPKPRSLNNNRQMLPLGSKAQKSKGELAILQSRHSCRSDDRLGFSFCRQPW